MEWMFIASLAVGIPLVTPSLFTALETGPDPATPERSTDLGAAVGGGLTVCGVVGLLALGFSAEPLVTGIAAVALGIAEASVHPDLVASLRRRAHRPNA